MINHAKLWIGRAKESALARNSVWMFLGYGVRIIVQAGYFVLIARALGSREYGAFVGTVALIAIAAPFAGAGAGNLLIKNVSRDQSLFAVYWGNALFSLLVSGLALMGVIVLVAHWILPRTIPMLLIVLICLSDMIGARLNDLAANAFQSMDRISFTARLGLAPFVLRLVSAVIIISVWHHASALTLGWFYLGSTAISCAVAIAVVNWKLGPPALELARIPREMKEGFYFGAGLSAQTIYNDIDKTMMASLSTLDATGIYGAAYRVIDVAFTPVRSVKDAAYANFFRSGQHGLGSSYAYAKRLLPRMAAYSVLAFFGLFVLAPLFPYVIGKDFARTVEALRWLAPLPLLKTISYMFSDSVTGAGYQGYRTAAQVSVALLNVGLNFWLIPAYSWRGAAWSSLACDATLALVMYAVLTVVMAREARMSTELAAKGA